jgi:hypothetical protein
LLKNLVRLYPETQFLGVSSGSVKADLGNLSDRVILRHVGVPTRLLQGWWTVFHKPGVDKLLGGLDVFHETRLFLPPTLRAA